MNIYEEYRFSIAALVGATLAAVRVSLATWVLRAIILLSGYGVAIYLGPWIAEHLHIDTDPSRMGFAFLCGYLGHYLLSLISEYAQSNLLTFLLSLIKEKKEKENV